MLFYGDLNVLLNFVLFYLVEYFYSLGVIVLELWIVGYEFEFVVFGFYLYLIELMFWKYNLFFKLNILFVYMRYLFFIY